MTYGPDHQLYKEVSGTATGGTKTTYKLRGYTLSPNQTLRLLEAGTIIGGLTPSGYLARKLLRQSVAVSVTKGAGSAAKKSDDVIHVTKDGVAIPADPKYKIPDNYVQNPHRSGNYGKIVDGKYKELLRIDPATPPGQKGPNDSHYHKNGKATHYSPKEGDPDPGF